VLRTDAPGSMRDAVRMLAHESFWIPAGKLSTTIRTGQTPFAEIFGGSFFDYFAQNPDLPAIAATRGSGADHRRGHSRRQ
jgi:hypothetical protein